MKITLKFLGRFEVCRDGHPIDHWPRQKTQALLELLASERGRCFTPDQLIEMLFLELDPTKAINNVQKRVSELRRMLEPDLTKGTQSQFVLQTKSRMQGYYFSKTVLCSVDIEEFQQHLDAAQLAEQAECWMKAIESYQRAIELYQGDFLSDDLYEEWTITPRERWCEKYLLALAHLAECHAHLGQLPQAIRCCERVLERDPLNESIYRQKMLYHCHAGEYPKAIVTYQVCVEKLSKQLKVEPTRETHQLHEQILKHEIPTLLHAIPNNLPKSWTSFIGRTREMAEIKQLLTGGVQGHTPLRLLTLTGVGGCGKSRLALEVSTDLLEHYIDGIWLVELASIFDSNLVLQAVASTLGAREQAAQPLLATISDYLHAKQLLLVLDNCEHLVDTCAQLVRALLKTCPKLQILATSREPLGIIGETVWSVPSLTTPVPKPALNLKILMQFESVRLFIERARASETHFELTEENAFAVTQVCHQLDGIPLAIELAATRVRALPIEEIAERLNDRFQLLVGGNRAALARHQTLQATMDWSYQLLSEQEQALLRRLSVFSGGWTFEVAEKVCADEVVKPHEVLALMTHLVDKSLVVMEEKDEEGRYRLLETVRQYGHEKLLKSGEAEFIRNHHLDFCLRFAEEAEPKLQGAEQKIWLNRLEVEHDNLRAALAWSLEGNNKVEAGLQLAGVLWRFWEVRGHFTEGRRWLEEALTKTPARTMARAKALKGAGNLAIDQGDYTAARSLYQESLIIQRELGDKPGITASLNNLGNVAYMQGNYAEARSLYEESLAIKRELGDQRGIAISLGNLGNVAREQEDYVSARSFHEESLIIKRELEDKRGIAFSLNNLGEVARAQGDYVSARSFHEESLIIKRELRDKQGITFSLNNLGYVVYAQGDYVAARAFYQESLSIQRELVDKQRIAESLQGLAGVDCAEGQCERATQLLAAAKSLRDAIDAVLEPAEQIEYDRIMATLRAGLGEEAFARVWAKGAAMTLQQAIEYALTKDARKCD
ncbi:tetratricopeptide repeat protein [Candidatus Acetothermia bacterium]|nr:tetratricopeptide repeat protein [Candidatus Acetothermia bacterium]